MATVNLGKQKILNEGFDKAGNSMIAIWSNPITIYQRRDGSFYFMDGNKQQNVTHRKDGTFYLATKEA